MKLTALTRRAKLFKHFVRIRGKILVCNLDNLRATAGARRKEHEYRVIRLALVQVCKRLALFARRKDLIERQQTPRRIRSRKFGRILAVRKLRSPRQHIGNADFRRKLQHTFRAEALVQRNKDTARSNDTEVLDKVRIGIIRRNAHAERLILRESLSLLRPIRRGAGNRRPKALKTDTAQLAARCVSADKCLFLPIASDNFF